MTLQQAMVLHKLYICVHFIIVYHLYEFGKTAQQQLLSSHVCLILEEARKQLLYLRKVFEPSRGWSLCSPTEFEECFRSLSIPILFILNIYLTLCK